MPELEDYDLDPKAVCCEAHCERVAPSGKAILVSFGDDDGEEYWIPMSQIHDDSEVFGAGDEGQLVITRWIAKEKGWI